MGKIKFGTDGFRGIIAQDFTFANLNSIAQAIADYLKEKKFKTKEKKVLVGFDRRFLSDKFAESVSTILSKNGIHVLLSPYSVPTPAVSHF
ncbi:MAG: phosphoglucomutase/phosphomannomutase family protein, partial [Candidatus Omnitrophota bacterium]